ncbi:hypothetical protein, partial [Staphylococcus aureus]
IHNIYGQYAIFVEGVAHLPGHLSPLLKKLLLKSYEIVNKSHQLLFKK